MIEYIFEILITIEIDNYNILKIEYKLQNNIYIIPLSALALESSTENVDICASKYLFNL